MPQHKLRFLRDIEIHRRWLFPTGALSWRYSRIRPGSVEIEPSLARLRQPVPQRSLPRLQPNSGLPEFGHILTGRSRINPTSAGGTGRGHARKFARFTPSPTLPRKREREHTEFAAR